jgi:Flp pilus assembly protein TadD
LKVNEHTRPPASAVIGTLLALAAALLPGSGRTAEGANEVTFRRDVAPLLWRKCASCHRSGQAAPFPLLSYADAAKRARQIAEVTARGVMPPWLPERGLVEFVGDRSLAPTEIELLQNWANAGAPEGDGLLPPLPAWSEGWSLGQPDLIITMPAKFELPAEGRDVYRNFVLPIPLTGARNVAAIEFNPGNRRIVHHAFFWLDRTPTSRRRDEQDAAPGFDGLHTPPTAMTPNGQFLSWQPGKVPSTNGAIPWRLEPGTDFLLQVHLQTSGRPEQLQSSIGFYFTEAAPLETLGKIGLRSYRIDIPAGETNYVLQDQYTLPVDAQVLAILPHAHYLARRMDAFALRPDGTKEWLLRIPNWDFNWQGDYRYARPIALPRGTTLAMEFHYDNSTNNVRNPHQPPRRVRYGVQSTDEMGELWLQLLTRDTNDLATLTRDYSVRALGDAAAYNEYLLGLNPRDPRALTELGKARAAQGQDALALKALREALTFDPDNEDAHYFLGLIYRKQRRFNYALPEFERVLRLNPAHYKAHNYRGLVLLELGRFDEAEQALRRALELNPGDEIAQGNLELTLKAKAAAKPPP